MTQPKTLLQIAGAPDKTVDWPNAALVLIDYQREYTEGKLALGHDGEAAVAQGSRLTDHARSIGRPVIHIIHNGAPGGALFDPDATTSHLIPPIEVRDNETAINKGLPNAFAGTSLHDTLQTMGVTQLVLAGFMSHMCVSSTARAGLDLGYENFVAADACATRDLPGPDNEIVDGKTLHNAAMAALADRFATVTTTKTLMA